ncbi:MAG TPA: glutathione S-transferase family protein [Rhizomicrobium sp.]|jgi:glutathione S-transferase|nr:glutathione S-transferase family protein [Rhizomicrobium sp.]
MITLYHAPRSRSSRIIWLLEELGCDYTIEITPIKRGDGTGEPAPDSYKAIHPLKKVPAIKVFDEIVYETPAICLYLTDSHQKHPMGPLPGHNDRAEYVRWLFFYSANVEPAATARFQGWDKDPAKPTGFGTLEEIEGVISAQLEKTPYLLGENFSAADIVYGSTIAFFKGTLFPARKHYDDYVARITSRPAYARSQAKDNG